MKIGGSNYFWSFKAKKDRLAQIQNDKTLKLIEQLKPQVAEAEARLSDAKRGREEDDDDDDEEEEEEKDSNRKDDGNDENKDEESSGDTACTSTTTEAATSTSTKKRVGDDGSGGRAKKLARLSELGKQKIELEKELDKLKENDPAALADLEKELQLVIQSANRWTDNIFECKSYLVKKRGMEKKEANKFLQISADFDCAYCSFPFFLCICVPLSLFFCSLALSFSIVIIRYSSSVIPSHTILFFLRLLFFLFFLLIYFSLPSKIPNKERERERTRMKTASIFSIAVS
jgi:hypothetical protein